MVAGPHPPFHVLSAQKGHTQIHLGLQDAPIAQLANSIMLLHQLTVLSVMLGNMQQLRGQSHVLAVWEERTAQVWQLVYACNALQDFLVVLKRPLNVGIAWQGSTAQLLG